MNFEKESRLFIESVPINAVPPYCIKPLIFLHRIETNLIEIVSIQICMAISWNILSILSGIFLNHLETGEEEKLSRFEKSCYSVLQEFCSKKKTFSF